MRLSSLQIFNQGLTGITNASAEVARTQQQITSNRRVVNPSDDPIASTKILELETELNQSAQFQRKADNIEGRLQRAETQINTIELAVDRIRELVIQSGNGALTNDDRLQITVEINQRLQEVVDLTNSRDETGSYIFAGFSNDKPAFVESGGNYIYQGDEGVRFEPVANGLSIASNETGKALFADIPTVNNSVTAQANPANSSDAQVAAARVTDQGAFDAVFPEDYLIRFNGLSNVAPPAANFTVTRLPDGQVLMADQPFDLATPIIINGVEIVLDSVPNPNDTIVVESTSKQNMLNTLTEIGSNLASFSDSDERSAFIADSINNLDNIQDALLSGRGRIGARLNTIEATRASQQSIDLITNQTLSELRDLDYAEAVSRLSFQSFVLEAAQQSFVRVANLSLFNFLR